MNYEQVSDPQLEAEQNEERRPTDVGSDALPFDHLSGRRFEILAYLLKRTLAGTGDSVTLVKSSKDRGRDVTVHRDGRLIEIVQCKNQADPMSAPDVVRETLKIALHAHLDSSLLPPNGNVTLSMWCPSGFTEEADSLIDEWPDRWKNSELKQRFAEVCQKYVAFKDLKWWGLRHFVKDFASRVTLTKHDAISLSQLIRDDAKLHLQFFSTVAVVKMDDAKQMVQGFMEDGAWRRIPGEDVRHVVDRLLEFPDDHRFYFGNAHLLGLSAELLARIPPEPLRRFVSKLSAPVLECARLLMDIPNARSLQLVQSEISKFEYSSRAFPVLLERCLAGRGMFFLLRTLAPASILEKLSEKNPVLASPELWHALDELCIRLWRQFDEILSPNFKPPTSDAATEAKRRALAENVLGEHREQGPFVEQLKNDCRRNLAAIRALVQTLEHELPKDMIVVVDSRSAFASDVMLMQLLRTADILEEARPTT